MKKALIWAVTMGLITAIFGVRLGMIPGLILSWIISDLVDKSENSKAERESIKTGGMIECPKCHTANNATNEFCRECGEPLSQTDNSTKIVEVYKKKGSTASSESKDLNNTDALLEFNNRIFPNNNRDYIKKQMRSITGNTTTDDENIKIYIYCMTHYLVNKAKIDYVMEMLPVAHPEIKDPEIAKKIAEYTLSCSVGDPSKIDITKQQNQKTVSAIADAFMQQEINRKANADKNKEPYDETRGLLREKPMYFYGVKNTEGYLNSLMDKDGNRLHIGRRYSYSVDGIPDMLDCYQMLEANGDKYGELFVSIYGMDNYQYVPKGYKHPSLSNPVTVKPTDIKQEKEDIEPEKEPETETVAIEKVDTEEKSPVPEQAKETHSFEISEDISNNRRPSLQIRDNVDTKPVFYGSSVVRFCRKCGTQLDEGVAFCRKCGTKIEQ